MKWYGIKYQWFDDVKEIMLVECESEFKPYSTQQGGYGTCYYNSQSARDKRAEDMTRRGAILVDQLS